MNQKDKGNQLFISKQYSQAIPHYLSYISTPHSDNHKAYFNLSLCYSKLSQRQTSIKYAEQALKIAPKYHKCYYRLAIQYDQIDGKEVESVINSVKFLQMARFEQEAKEREEMKRICQKNQKKIKEQGYRQQKNINLQDMEIMIGINYRIEEQRQSQPQIDVQIDLWKYQWMKNPQQFQAQWLEIQYIIQDINYQHGINLAYFFYNHHHNPQIKKIIANNIIEIEQRIGKHNHLSLDQLDIKNEENLDKGEEDGYDQEVLNDTKGQGQKTKKADEEKKEADRRKAEEKANNTKIDQKERKKKQKGQKKKMKQVKKKDKIIKESSMFDKFIINLEQISPIKTEFQAAKTKQPSKVNQDQAQKQKKFQETVFASKNQVPIKKQQIPTPIPSPSVPPPKPSPFAKKAPLQNLSSNPSKTYLTLKQPFQPPQDIQSLYHHHCSSLTTSKDIFTATYSSVFSICQDNQLQPSTKGQILSLMRTRVKKFDKIMASTSQKQQKILYDILALNKMSAEAKDLTPKFYCT